MAEAPSGLVPGEEVGIGADEDSEVPGGKGGTEIVSKMV